VTFTHLFIHAPKNCPRCCGQALAKVAAHRAGAILRQVAKDFNETKSTVQRWVVFAKGQRLDRVDFHDKKSGTSQPTNKSPNKLEKRVLQVRKYLKDKSVLGLHGADAIRAEMLRRGDREVPASRTIGNILKRNSMIDKRTRLRRPAPPPGWYLPDLLKQKVELDSFDILEGLYLHGGQEVQFLNGLSLHGNLLHSSPMATVSTENTVLALIEHWKQFGLPKYVQFDNDMVFQGPRRENVIGKVIRLCLSLNVFLFSRHRMSRVFKERLSGSIGRYKKSFGGAKHSKISRMLQSIWKNMCKPIGSLIKRKSYRHRVVGRFQNDGNGTTKNCRQERLFICAERMDRDA